LIKRLLVLTALMCAAFVPATTASAASPKCSGTASWGKILYQACFRYNCDSTSCNTRGYLGLINTATSARTVSWDLDSAPNGIWRNDDTGQVTLAAGEQRTIFSTNPVSYECGIPFYESLRVLYDSAGWSSWVGTNDFMHCV
jgi:hypothetical protein